MSSQSRIDANRANAQHSTGPRSPEGKARVAQNATKHGLNSPQIFIRPGEEALFDDFQRDLRAQIQPAGALENDLFQQLLHAAWNLRRIRCLEAELLANSDIDPLLDDDAEAKTNRLARHQARYERTYHRTLRALKELQTNRHLAELYARETGLHATATANAEFLLKQTHAPDPKSSPKDPDDDDSAPITPEEQAAFEKMLAEMIQESAKK